MKKILILCGALMLTLTLAACGHKAQTVDNKVKGLTDPQSIEQSITLAARSLGWDVKHIDSQTMDATIKSREEQLTVTITYTPQSYIIQYKDSLNLDWDARDNSIDSQYTKWVEALDERIQEEMKRVK